LYLSFCADTCDICLSASETRVLFGQAYSCVEQSRPCRLLYGRSMFRHLGYSSNFVSFFAPTLIS